MHTEKELVQLVSRFGNEVFWNDKVPLQDAKCWIEQMKKENKDRFDRDFWAEDKKGKKVA
jgi:hypothetical protein